MSEKPAGTSAAATAFCSAKLEGPGGHLWIDGNGKITAGNGTLDAPKPNAFSLVQILDCPGSTEVCRVSCYVHSLEKHAPATHALYRHNSETIRRIVAGYSEHFEPRVDDPSTWAVLLADWIFDNCQGGFRWHVSGDVFSIDYAHWIADVCKMSFPVPHWIYTRSFSYLEPLVEVSTKRGGNLALNLSADAANWPAAKHASTMYGLRLCYLSHNGRVPEGLIPTDVIFPDYALRGGTEEGAAWFSALAPAYKKLVCVVDYHGKSERRRCGPCDRCLT